LVHGPPYSPTVTRKVSMLWVITFPWLEQESAFLATSKMIAIAVIPESGLVHEDSTMTPTRVETRQGTHKATETNTSKPWDTSWCSEDSFSSPLRALDSKQKRIFLQ